MKSNIFLMKIFNEDIFHKIIKLNSIKYYIILTKIVVFVFFIKDVHFNYYQRYTILMK